MAFTDDFTNAGSTQDLGARTGWTRVDGTNLDLKITGSGTALDSQGIDETAYRCTSQASADHYSQAVWKDASSNVSPFLCVRVTDSNNWIGVRANGGDWQLYKRDTGSFSNIGSYTAASADGDVVKVRATGNSIVVSINGTDRITVTEAFNNTELRQGVVAHAGSSMAPWIDDFEAGAVGGTPTPNPPLPPQVLSQAAGRAGFY